MQQLPLFTRTPQRLAKNPLLALFAPCAFAFSFSVANPAAAQITVTKPGQYPEYGFEIQPYIGLFGVFPNPSNSSFAAGARVNWMLIEDGFIPAINDSIALTTGVDLRLGSEFCHSHGGSHCHSNLAFAVPVGMQWNLWFTRGLSAFAEPGVIFSTRDHENLVGPAFWIGGRYLFRSGLALTGRVNVLNTSVGGFANASFGISWLL